MKSTRTIGAIVGTKPEQLPSRVTIFMDVDQEAFPEKLGPFTMVRTPFEAKDFKIPELTRDIRDGFYWGMKTSVLENHGFKERSDLITGQVSPLHPLHDDAFLLTATWSRLRHKTLHGPIR